MTMTPELQALVNAYFMPLMIGVGSVFLAVFGAFAWFVRRILSQQDDLIKTAKDSAKSCDDVAKMCSDLQSDFTAYVVTSQKDHKEMLDKYHRLDKELHSTMRDARDASQKITEMSGGMEVLRKTLSENSDKVTLVTKMASKMFEVLEADPRASDAVIAVKEMRQELKSKTGG